MPLVHIEGFGFFKVFYAVPFDPWKFHLRFLGLYLGDCGISQFYDSWVSFLFTFLEHSTIFELYFFLKSLSARFLKFVTYFSLCRFLIFHTYCPNLLNLKWNCSWFSIPLLIIAANFVILLGCFTFSHSWWRLWTYEVFLITLICTGFHRKYRDSPLWIHICQ